MQIQKMVNFFMTPAKCLLIKCTDQTHAKHKNKYQMNNNTLIQPPFNRIYTVHLELRGMHTKTSSLRFD